MKQKICLKKLRAVEVKPSNNNNESLSATFAANMMSYGFTMTRELYNAVSTLSQYDVSILHDDVMSHIKEIKGADVDYRPFYPNFPEQVMDADTIELFLNAIMHYWTAGQWSPNYNKLPRELKFEKIKFEEIGLTNDQEFRSVFTKLLSSNDSLSSEDRSIIEWFIKNEDNLDYPENIPFKENMCVVAGMFIKQGRSISKLVKSATDVLRVVTYLNDGDISLASNTKFKSMPRSQRRMFIKLLDNVASEEDINRHAGKWVKLFHSLHVGDYSCRLYNIATKIRNNKIIKTFNSRVHELIDGNEFVGASQLLMDRPSEFARRLDHLVRRSSADDKDKIVDNFAKIVNKLPTRVMVQLIGHFKSRNSLTERVVFPKGQTQKARIIDAHQEKIPVRVVERILNSMSSSLMVRFSELPALGNVWIDNELANCPIPTQQRSANTSMKNVARGTRLPLGDAEKNTLRFFIYWVGRDIDLSATLHDDNFKMIDSISYTHLRSKSIEACHSGDIIDAPHGASEFIDITIDKALNHGIRYIVMNVMVYSGPAFKDHEKCYVGWMMRSNPGSNEIYDPKTVEQKIDLTSNSRNSIPMIVDLLERKIIWTDLSTSRSTFYGGNNVHSNKATITQKLKAMIRLNNKMSLQELFILHAKVRGTLVDNKEDADSVFSLNGGVTPYDINEIQSNYLV